MKRTITYFRLKGIKETKTLIKCIGEDVFELLGDIPQVASKQDVIDAIDNKINDVPK